MTPFLLLPVKPPAEAKSRLARVLSDAARAELAATLFDHVLRTSLQVFDSKNLLVVSRSPALLTDAVARGVGIVRESAECGLNEALAAGSDEAVRRGADAVLVLPCDLPSLSAADIEALLSAACPKGVVIAPDSRDQGTNALLLSPPDALPFAFGEDSFAAHVMAARTRGIDPVILRRPGLAFDVDTAEDYERLQRRADQPALG